MKVEVKQSVTRSGRGSGVDDLMLCEQGHGSVVGDAVVSGIILMSEGDLDFTQDQSQGKIHICHFKFTI